MVEEELIVKEEERPRRHPAVQEQPLGEEVLLYHREKGQVGLLNATAHFIWQRCDGKHTVQGIVAALRESFAGAEAHDLRAEVEQTLRTLAAGGLVVMEGDTLE